MELSVDVVRNVCKNISIYFDTKRLTYPIWCYYYSVYGVSANDYGKVNLEDYYNYGISFPNPTTNEIWIKCLVKHDTYIGKSTWYLSIGAYANTDDDDDAIVNGISIWNRIPTGFQSANGYFVILGQEDDLSLNIYGQPTLKQNSSLPIIIHLKSGKTDGLIEIVHQDGTTGSFTGNVNNGKPFEKIFYWRKDNLYSACDFIVSNQELTHNDIFLYDIALNFRTQRNIDNFGTHFPMLFADTVRLVHKDVQITFNAAMCRNILKNITSYHDTQRRVTYNGVWRYENYGTANLLSIAGTTVTDLTKSQAIYKSAFYQPTRAKCFDIPATKEIWIKFDVYFDGTNRWRAYNATNNTYFNGISAQQTSSSTGILSFFAQTNQSVYQAEGVSKKNQRQTYLLHMVSNSSAGIVEAWVDGTFIYRDVGNVNNGDDFADIYLQSDGAGTFFSNVIISNAQIDINEHTTYNAAFNADLLLAIIDVHQELFFHSLRNVVSSQQIYFPLCRHLISANDIVFDTFRNVLRTVDLDCDIVRTLPHKIFLSVIADNPNNLLAESADIIDVPEDNEDLQSFEISINEQQLTDVVTFSSVNHFNLLEQVKGQYLDYKFNLRIEPMQERGILSSCQCCSDIDEILYTQIDYKIPKNEHWDYIKSGTDTSVPSSVETVQADKNKAKASTHVKYLAGVFGKQPVMQFDDFVSTVDVKAGGVTYNDLIRSIFGWTSRIPHKLINCYLRDDKLFIIQRGHENNVVDLTGTTFEIVSRDKSLVRTFWGSSTFSKTVPREVLTSTSSSSYGWVVNDDDDDDDDEPDEPVPDELGNTRNRDGLLIKTEKIENGIKTVTEFSYDDDGSVIETIETVSKLGGVQLSKTTTEYSYYTTAGGRKVLLKEIVWISENGKLVDKRETTHNYLSDGSGQVYVSTNNSDGDHLGNIAGESNGDVRQTPFATYTSEKENRSSDYGGLADSSITDKDPSQYTPPQLTIYGITPYDTSFPVHGVEDLVKITDAIKWLNRKTMEVVTINLFDFPHVIDFNDRILLEGNEYFLKSNTAIQNNRIVNKQTLSIVRWY